MKTNTRDLLENVSAISAELHGNRKRYEAFYKRHAASLGGFPAIWDLCIDAAEAYSAEEIAATHKHEWLDAIEDYVSELCKLDYCTESDMHAAARRVIKQHATYPK